MQQFLVGLDVGSTTVKAIVVDAGEAHFSQVVREPSGID